MTWEATISYVTVDSKGNDRKVNERYVIGDGASFSDVEEVLFSRFAHETDFCVEAVRRSKIKEIANRRDNEDDLLWIAEMQDVFHTEEGEEKYTKYKVLFFSKTYVSANTFITEYAKQGYDMSLVSLKLTKFSDVL